METARQDNCSSFAELLRGFSAVLAKTKKICEFGNIVSMIFFIIMVFLTFFDVFLRYFFNHPISGSVECTELMMVILYFSGLAKAQWDHAHTSMDIITGKLNDRNKSRLEFLTNAELSSQSKSFCMRCCTWLDNSAF